MRTILIFKNHIAYEINYLLAETGECNKTHNSSSEHIPKHDTLQFRPTLVTSPTVFCVASVVYLEFI